MDTDNDIQFSLCWFDKEQWELLAKIDPDGVDDSYEEWRKNANEAISNFSANGQNLVKVSIKVAELQEWCKTKVLSQTVVHVQSLQQCFHSKGMKIKKHNKSIKFASKRRWLGLRKKRSATYFGRYVL